MSSPAEQFPTGPEDPDHTPPGSPSDSTPGDRRSADAGARRQAHRRRLTLQEQAQATLAKKVAKAARAHRRIAKDSAKRARALAELRQWSSDPINAKLLNPDYADHSLAAGSGSPLTDANASGRTVAAWEDQEVARRTVISEVACSLHLAAHTAENLIGEAEVFAGPLKATLDAMSTGEVSYRHGQCLLQQLSFIPLDEVADLEAKLLPAAREVPVGKLTAKARRLRERLHPETITKRVTAAVTERGVWWEAQPDGMGTLSWYGTAEQTLAAHDRLTGIATGVQKLEHADASIDDDHRRSIGQICADAMADLLLDGVTPTGTGGGIRGSVMVTVPVLTLIGTSTEPGQLDGYGPIPAETAREIAAGAPSFCRLLTHPETGVVLSVGKEQYSVPADLRRWLRLRDGTCRFPGCNRPASRSDIDHTEAWAGGGATDYDNLAHLCAPHHRVKHRTLWTVLAEPGGVLCWTSPGGQTHRTYPETALGPPATQPPAPKPPAPPAARPSDQSNEPPPF